MQGWSWINHGYPNVANLPGESGWLFFHQKKDSASFFRAPGTGLSWAEGAGMQKCNPKVRPLPRNVCNPFLTSFFTLSRILL
jgi:hypothetical protein